MTAYRIYVVDREGHVTGPPYIVYCANDPEAIQQARKYVGREPVEIWLDATRIGRLEPKTGNLGE